MATDEERKAVEDAAKSGYETIRTDVDRYPLGAPRRSYYKCLVCGWVFERERGEPLPRSDKKCSHEFEEVK